jgi:hypothetical protein
MPHVLTLVLALTAGAAGPSRPPGASQEPIPPFSAAYLALLPDGPVKRQFILDCTGCHTFDGRIAFPQGAPRSLQSWRDQIQSMHTRFGKGSAFPIIADPAPADTLAAWLARYLTAVPAPIVAANHDPRVTEFAIPAPGDLPHDILVAPDGQVVITAMFTHRMYVRDPVTGTFTTEAIPVAMTNPRAHHIDPDGTWWVVLGVRAGSRGAHRTVRGARSRSACTRTAWPGTRQECG